MSIITRKIEILSIAIENYNEETKLYELNKEAYTTLRDYRHQCWRLGNKVVSGYYLLLQEYYRRNKEVSEQEIVKEWSNGECQTVANYDYYLSKEFSEVLPSGIRQQLVKMAKEKYQSSRKDVLFGKESLLNFKLANMNIPFPAKGTKIFEENKKYILKPAFKGDLHFLLNFGRDRSNNRIIIKRIIEGKYKLSDSYFKFEKSLYKSKDKEKLFFYMVVKIPEENRNSLCPDTYVGVDLGIKKPAVCAVNNGKGSKFIGDGKFINDKRRYFEREKLNIKRSVNTMSKGGKGYKRKMRPVDNIRDKEARFFKNLNHAMSKQIVQFALTQKASVIKFEFLEGFAENHRYSKFLKNWTYFKLQTLTIAKAKKHGIEVVKVDPYHTSQTCAECGHYEPGQRTDQATFVCNNPECKEHGVKINADLNASRNIAKSTKIVTKKEECEYHKKTFKKSKEKKVA